MMHCIEANTCGEAWLELVRLVLASGTAGHDADELLIETLHVVTTIASPMCSSDPHIRLAEQSHIQRGLKKFASTELLPGAAFSYGQRLRDMDGVDQLSWAEDRLRRKPETKSATMSTLIPGDRSDHLPCLSLLDFKIREGRLCMSSVFRSQNVLTRHPGNSLALGKVQNELAAHLHVDVGMHVMYIISAHVYDKELRQVSDALREALGDGLVSRGVREMRP